MQSAIWKKSSCTKNVSQHIFIFFIIIIIITVTITILILIIIILIIIIMFLLTKITKFYADKWGREGVGDDIQG